MLSRSDPLDPLVGPTLVGPSNNSVIQAYVRPGTGYRRLQYPWCRAAPLRRYTQINRPAENGLTKKLTVYRSKGSLFLIER